MSDHSYVRRQATTTTTPSTPSDRHLLLIEVSDTIKRDEIAAAKYDNVDVIYVSRETFSHVADTMKQFNTQWRSINMLFHGSADLAENSVDMFGIKMSMNPVLMAKDPNVVDFIAFTKAVCQYTNDSLYIYTCAVGLADGFKSLCLQMDVKLVNGIYLSTNITGNGVGQDWDVEWGTKTGFLTTGVHTNEIEHAQICLFKEIKLLTFVLMTESSRAVSLMVDADAAAVRAEQIAADTADAAVVTEEERLAAEKELAKEKELARDLKVKILRAVSPQYLTSTKIAENWGWLTSTQIREMPLLAFGLMDITKLSAPQARDGLTAGRIPSLSDTQILSLTTTHLNEFVLKQVWALEDRVGLTFGKLNTAQIQMLSRAQIRACDINKLTIGIGKLTDKQIKCLSAGQIEKMGDLCTNLTPTQIKAFDRDVFPAFSPNQLSFFSWEQVQAITEEQLIRIAAPETKEQVDALIASTFLTVRQKAALFSRGVESGVESGEMGQAEALDKLVKGNFDNWNYTNPPLHLLREISKINIKKLAEKLTIQYVIGNLSQAYLENNFTEICELKYIKYVTRKQIHGFTEYFLKYVITPDQVMSFSVDQFTWTAGCFFYYISTGVLVQKLLDEKMITKDQFEAYKTNTM